MNSILKKYKSYITLEQGLSNNTREAYLHDVEKLFTYFEDEKIDFLKVELEHFHSFAAALMDVGIGERSIARILSGIRSFYKFLVLDGYLEQDPTELLESPKIGKHLPEVLSVEEIDAIEGIIDVSTPEGQRDRAAIEMLYSCGLRVSELCNLLLSDLFLDETEDEAEADLRIVKNKKFELHPMTPEEACLQMELLGHAFFIFLNGDSGNVEVVYKRRDGSYGLIEPRV